MFGTINGALPFTLIAWGETHIDSGVAAIANASVPIFVALLAIKFNPAERSSGMKLVGILVGLLGVGVLAGVHPEGGGWAVAGTLAVVLASLSYAAGGLYGQRALGRAIRACARDRVDALRRARSCCRSPLFQLPDHAPGWKPVAVAARAGRARHRDRAAAPVPDPAALRRGAALARHVPDPGVRARCTAR